MVINSKDFIQVGRIGRPKGTKGLLRFQCFLHDHREINDFKNFYLENSEKIELKLVSFDSKGPIVTINNYTERSKTENFVNQFVFLEKNILTNLLKKMNFIFMISKD